MDTQVYDQLTNVATLPGIISHAYCMPDGHSGYGFPIGGVAAMDLEEGVISPGGIGFDINCVSGDTKILTKYGYFKKIMDFEREASLDAISCMDIETFGKHKASAAIFLKKKADKGVLKITTATGQEIILTEDHPLYNGTCFLNAGTLKTGDTLVIHPFDGVEYEEPSGDVILTEKDIISIVGERSDIIDALKKRDLLPLRLNSRHTPLLAKLVGFLTGDGWIGKYHNKKKKQNVWSSRVIGKMEDLEEVMGDVRSLGYKTSHISCKEYNSSVSEIGGIKREIKGISRQLHIMNQSFAVLMKALGVPEGNKSRNPTLVPEWVKKSPLWIKRLYLAGLFGAELTIPYQRKGEQFGFTEPSFSQNKIESMEKDNKQFLSDIIRLLSEFGIKINKIYKQKGVVNSYGENTYKMSIRISANIDNLINLWSKVGYEYCKERKEKSMHAIAFLRKKKRLLEKIRTFTLEARKSSENGISRDGIMSKAIKEGLNAATIYSQLVRGSTEVRTPQNFQTFQEFVGIHGIPNSEFVKDIIESIEEIPFDEDVYDFVMDDENHNFIANGIVSHNCGMRLLRTNFTYEDVKPKLKELVDLLFQRVPAGVGSEGFVKLNAQKFREAIMGGAKWCVEQGYGWEKDLEMIEEDGCMKGADESKVSDRAVKRGLNQIGTLGSGNHYLEVQVVREENIIDREIAEKMGIFPGQIVVMFHCGSRGFGHQVATDYLQTFLNVMESKYKIRILDKELACAPFSSKEGQDYFKAMQCGINMSFANRQVILHRIRECFSKVFSRPAESMEMEMIYDVAQKARRAHSAPAGRKCPINTALSASPS
ncbi:MAG: RtcB family protein [Candidatus Aenigmarchaeota archaeon]|nr:RtcB family protein [Candidatus Aenigmarchaeota archaeon]